jgi:integrase
MASLTKDKHGTHVIQFTDGNRKRRTIRMEKEFPLRAVNEVRRLVDMLNACAIAGTGWDPKTAEWVADLKAVLYDKLAKAGLLPPRAEAEETTLEKFIDRYVERRTDVKPASKEVWRQGKLGLIEFFGEQRRIATINPGMADDYKQHLIATSRKSRAKKPDAENQEHSPAKTLAPMTVRKRLQFANMIFRTAVRHRLIDSNPFAGVGVKASMPDRHRFVTRAETDKLLEACPPGQDWRTIIVLSRYGGLRCPSEVLSLKLSDIDWENNRITVTSPKTAHHPGKESRVMPLFPELRAELLRAAEAAPEGAVYVVDERFRRNAIGPQGWRNCNLRTTMEKIIKRAGMTVWPRPFHNLRSSRQTELSERFPTHVVCAWLGNSPDVAREHYLQVTDAHFEAAAADALHEALHGQATTYVNQQQPVSNSSEKTTCLASKTDGEGFEPTVDFHPRRFSRPVP